MDATPAPKNHKNPTSYGKVTERVTEVTEKVTEDEQQIHSLLLEELAYTYTNLSEKLSISC